MFRSAKMSWATATADVAFVRQTWESLVVPNHTLFIGLLVVFEATTGILVLFAGRPRQLALLALIAFNTAVVSFSWFYLFWSAPIVVALGLLLRAERRRARLHLRPGAGDDTPAANPAEVIAHAHRPD